jgi:hypothetical protein
MRWFKKMKEAIKQQNKLDEWKSKYTKAKDAYAETLERMRNQEMLYDGDAFTRRSKNKGGGIANKQSENVRNIVYELLETEVDSSIPMPKVTAIHEEDQAQAQIIEQMLLNEIRLLRFKEMNDVSERVTTVQGGDWYHTEWDTRKGSHCTIGGLEINERSPQTVIPQAGVTDPYKLDYVFILITMTKDAVKRNYDVDVSDEKNTEAEGNKEINDELVTVIKTYYRDKNGEIGIFTWCGDTILEDMENYQARRLTRCKKCGRVKEGDVCECGSKSFETSIEEYEEVEEDIISLSLDKNGERMRIPAYEDEETPVVGEDGLPMVDEFGQPKMEITRKHTQIPYYKPNVMPLVLRRNVSKSKSLLGVSDAAVIEDQQDAIKKYGSKLQEKILKGGSIVTLPQNKKIETTDEELKIVRVENPNDVSMIGVHNLVADISYDRIAMSDNYEAARSTLGITDAYQGKYDASAVSGTAKQYSINQAAGRMESKRIMKQEAYCRLYEVMFKFMLAYADQPVALSTKRPDGSYEFTHFNRYEFLKMDESGNLYWNDEFIFEVDPTSTIMMNREAMWQQIDLKLQTGAFGPLDDPNTLLNYWTFMEKNDYPHASEIRQMFADKMEEIKKAQEQQMQQQQIMQMLQGVQNGTPMPQM